MFIAVAICFADGQKPTADALISNAAAAMDLSHSPVPLRLRAEWKIPNNKGEMASGTYTLLWTPEGDWREQIAFHGYQETHTYRHSRLYIERSAELEPMAIYQLRSAMHWGMFLRHELYSEKLKRERHKGVSLQCVRGIDPDAMSICFQEDSGRLYRFGNALYSDYAQVSGVTIPREIQIRVSRESGLLKASSSVVEIAPDAAIDVASWVVGPNAVAWDSCSTPLPPNATIKTPPHYPEAARRNRVSGTVSFWGVVGTDGMLHDLALVESAGAALDGATRDALSTWVYEPANCAGRPVNMETVVTVNYSIRP